MAGAEYAQTELISADENMSMRISTPWARPVQENPFRRLTTREIAGAKIL